MRQNIVIASFFSAVLLTLSSCAAIGGIFKAGMWVGVIVVVVIVALVLWLIGKTRR